ncbi:hypothetical protein GCM10007362_30220 [Saccharibacillus endophyticus]|uniref:Uncharacterized protein n=1 Tax=Saccharibacillus endophyticus TaxID=2060666 RepID=A0ABQ1ZXF9_9BACL|nr:hypothetical protein GCM10007362_30220 [Saccharibacillus endophyticus]
MQKALAQYAGLHGVAVIEGAKGSDSLFPEQGIRHVFTSFPGHTSRQPSIEVG